MTQSMRSSHLVIFSLVLSAALLAPLWVSTTEEAQAIAHQGPATSTLLLPRQDASVRFAVIGDTGRGSREQNEVGKQMMAFHKEFPFEFVIMMGDNIYGADSPADMKNKFETPYKALLDAGVKFWASLGNHDNPTQRFYKPFNMGGERYYTFRPARTEQARFFALDTNYIDKVQLDWLEKELRGSASNWKIAFFHHPLYSSGKTHGSSLESRAVLEPLFVKYGVSAVFSGHDHLYERIKPQKGGITYWVSGAGGSLRKGDLGRTDLTAKGFDTDYHFMLVEISGDDLYFQAISRTGTTVDSGVVHRPGAPAATAEVAQSPAAVPVAVPSVATAVRSTTEAEPAGTPSSSPGSVAPVPAPTKAHPAPVSALSPRPSPAPHGGIHTPTPSPSPRLPTPSTKKRPVVKKRPTPGPAPTPSPRPKV